jgi:hypothetical protein
MSTEDLNEARNENNLAGRFFPIGGIDEVYQKWNRTAEDDVAGGASESTSNFTLHLLKLF